MKNDFQPKSFPDFKRCCDNKSDTGYGGDRLNGARQTSINATAASTESADTAAYNEIMNPG